jgi:hypothetical protein
MNLIERARISYRNGDHEPLRDHKEIRARGWEPRTILPTTATDAEDDGVA